MKLKAEAIRYSSVVGGGVLLLDERGAAAFQLALIGTTKGISKDQNGVIAARLVELINTHGLEIADPPPPAPKDPPPPVDRSQRTLTDGSPVTADHRELQPNGQQKGYVVLSAEERAKGFVRPVRRSYMHVKCGGVTTMSQELAETYARDPDFYSGTFCWQCRKHFTFGQPDGDFTWSGTNEKVGA